MAVFTSQPAAEQMQVSAFTIRELTGQARTLRLVGRALPYRPYTLSGKQRSEFTWYPGSPVATVQVLGAEEDPSTIRGFWKDRFIKSSNEEELLAGVQFVLGASENVETVENQPPATLDDVAVRNVHDLALLVDNIRRQGQLVEVTWVDMPRVGLMTQFRQTWHDHKDLEWEIEFTWLSQGEDELNPLSATKEADLSELTSHLATETAAFERAQVPLFARILGYSQQVADAITDYRTAVTGLQDGLGNFIDGSITVLDTVRRSIGLLEFVQQTSDDLINLTYSTVDAAKRSLGVNGPFTIGGDPPGGVRDISVFTVGEVVQAAHNARVIVSASRRAKHAAVREKIKLSRALDPDLVRTFYAREGQDLRDVSRQFFGTPDEWRAIGRFNGITGSELHAGQVVLVPQSPQRGQEC